MSDNQFLEGAWARLSEVAVKGAQYNSPERLPHPKCLQGTRIDLLKYIYGFLDDTKKNKFIWLHGTAGVGKSAVAFTVADRMRGLKVTEETNVETRLAGTFFFSRKHTKRCTAGYFFATLVYQLAINFPSIRKDVSRIIRDNSALLDPDAPLSDQMEAFFLRPLRQLRSRLTGCPPLSFVIDALDECISEREITDLIISLAQALRDPDIPATHVLLTSRFESHMSKAFQNDEVWPLHSFRQLQLRHPDFPQPSSGDLAKLASRAGSRFIVASTMMKFIDDEYSDPRDRLELMLELTNELLPGTEVYKLYDVILSTCADPNRAYQHLSIVAALADPLPLSQISKLLGPVQGYNVESTLMQLRSVMDIPTDNTLPVNIYHSSIRDYVSDPSNCGLLQVHNILSPHSLLAHSSLRLIRTIPKSTALLDALSELKEQSKAMQPEDPQKLKDSLAFLVQPPEPLSAILCMLWLRGDRTSDLQSWLGTVDGRAWLEIQGGQEWLETQRGQEWLEIQGGQEWLQAWLQTRGGRKWLQTQGGPEWLETWLDTQGGLDWLEALGGRDSSLIEGERQRQQGLPKQRGQDWLQTREGQDWLQTQEGQDWLQTQEGRYWLQTQIGRDWLQTPYGQAWQSTPAASVSATIEEFLMTSEAIDEYIITSDPPAFQLIQQFKTFPDFLMFPVFLALKHRHHSTSAIPENLLPDKEIIHAVDAFGSFANEALERSRTASDALKYACHYWAVHLSRAPNQWDDTLNRTFQAFQNDHIIPWLEMEWCLNGLLSCLVILSEGQKFVTVAERRIDRSSRSQSHPRPRRSHRPEQLRTRASSL